MRVRAVQCSAEHGPRRPRDNCLLVPRVGPGCTCRGVPPTRGGASASAALLRGRYEEARGVRANLDHVAQRADLALAVGLEACLCVCVGGGAGYAAAGRGSAGDSGSTGAHGHTRGALLVVHTYTRVRDDGLSEAGAAL